MASADMEMVGGVVPVNYRRLASIGASGAAPQNAHRDLLTALGVVPKVALEVEFPFHAQNVLQYQQLNQSLLLPHSMFAHLYANHQGAFHHFLLGGNQNAEAFWVALEDTEHYTNHWVKDDQNRGTLVPLGLHGDAVPVVGRGKSWSKSLEIYSWSSLMAAGSRICMEQHGRLQNSKFGL